MIAAILTAGRLALAITSDDVPPDRAWSAAVAIVVAADEYDPALIAAIGYGESRYQPDAISAPTIETRCTATGCRQITYRDCGPMQVRTSSPARCQRLRRDDLYGYRAGVQRLRRDDLYGYRAGVQRLRDAREFCGWRGDVSLACAIAGYQGGPPGVRAYERGSARRTEKREELLRRADGIRARMGAAAIGGWS